MVKAMGAGAVRKEYLAVVHGRPEPAAGQILLRLRRDPSDSRRVAASEAEGKESRTGYATLAASPDGRFALLRCELFTGRMHQVRAHLAARGWPLVGDPVYGSGDSLASAIARQALHSWRLSFTHPLDGQPLVIRAPLPGDLTAVLHETRIEEPADLR
jgi:23S rRNA pseudouridine1911/1915/1917 synthase